jgi:ferrous iron transport protein B
MTYPGLSEEQLRSFQERRANLTHSFLASSDIRELITSEKDLIELDGLYGSYVRAIPGNDLLIAEEVNRNHLLALAVAAASLEKGNTLSYKIDTRHLKAASQYLKYRGDRADINVLEQEATLKRTIAGWIGRRLETISRPLGFDYRINIALVGGFAAKEVVVSTLGTAYSLGKPDSEEASSLSEKLKNDPNWTPLLALTLIIFTMLYVPCFVTVISIRQESSWRWAAFSIAFNLFAAYLVCLVIRQGGVLLGLGT